MPPPRNGAGRPPAQEKRPAKPDSTAAIENAAPTARGASTPIVRQRRAPGEHRKSAVTMRVTMLPPSGRRTMWWALGRCPVCGVPHLSRSRELDQVTRTRRLPCRHWVQPVIARSLSPYPATRAA